LKALVVLAHPEPQSFNGALARRAEATLQALGHEVKVTDLYQEKFKGIPDADDFSVRGDPSYLRIDREQTYSRDNGVVPPDVLEQQRLVDEADLLILQFPIWWYSMPAMLKGWAERVFTRGWGYMPGMKYDNGLHAGKLAMVSCTTGTTESTYAPDGIDGDIMALLWPVHNGLLRYAGMDVLTPFISFAPESIGEEGRRATLEAYDQHLASLETLPRLFFHSLDEYGPDLRLLPHVEPRSGFQRRPG
jgi:NAD(P)H dehydrogenase (quinone)